MEHTARNYHAHGGSEWVVGGKLTFLPGATVEGAEGLVRFAPWRRMYFALYRRQRGGRQWPRSGRTSTALLSALREAGVMASAPDE